MPFLELSGAEKLVCLQIQFLDTKQKSEKAKSKNVRNVFCLP